MGSSTASDEPDIAGPAPGLRRPPEVAAAFELARRGRPGWWSFLLGNIGILILEPLLRTDAIALGLTALNAVLLISKGVLMLRWRSIYCRRPEGAILAFGVLSAVQAGAFSLGVGLLVTDHRMDSLRFVALLAALACAQAAVVAQCPHLKIMRIGVAAYLIPAALGIFSTGGLGGIAAGGLLTVELIFLFYQGGQMHAAYWQTLRENRELLLAREQADQASRSKSQFLARVSHELRTPLHGLMGMTSLVLDSPIDAEQRDNLETAQRSAMGLLELVNHLLDLNKIEANRVELEQIPFRVEDVLEQVVKPLRHVTQAKGIELTLDPGDAGGERLIGDPGRLRQILTNLVGNAVKFTERGSVRVCVSAERRIDDRHVQLEVTVSDTGIGIPGDSLGRIFDPFRQGDVSVTRQFGGTGLGLAISRNLTELMGGQLEVASTGPGGSTFRFVCRFAEAGRCVDVAPANRAGSAGEWKSARRLRILVADDSPVNRRLAQKQLLKWGHDVAFAEDGHQTIDAASAGGFDLILMDVLMPGLDGTRAAERLRQIGIETPIVAVTANALEHQRRECLDAGMNGVLPKPFSARDLFETVEAFGNGDACLDATRPT